MGVEIKIVNNSKEILNELHRRVPLILESCGEVAQGHAMDDCPVDTSRLKNSIAYEVSQADNSMYVGTNVEYGIFVETDDTKRHPRGGKAHFLRDSLAKHVKEYEGIIRSGL